MAARRCSTRSGTPTRSRRACSTSTCTSVHEVTSPQAFEGLRLAGRKVRRPDRTLATADHNVPTDGSTIARADQGPPQPRPGRDARAQLRRVRRPDLLDRLGPPGHRPRDRPGARRHPARHDDRLRRLAHRHARRVRRARLRHRHERGRARAGHPDAPAAQAEVDADPLRGRARLRRHRQGPDPRHDRPDGRRRRRRPRDRVRRRRRSRALDGGPHDDLQHDDRGRRPRGHDRPGRDDLRVARGPRGRARRLRRCRRRVARALHRRRRDLRQGGRDRRRGALAAGHLGHHPEMVVAGHRRGAGAERRGRRARARVHGPRGRHADRRDQARPRVHRLVHELADRRPARRRRGRQGPQGPRRRRDGRARLAAGEGAGRGGGPRRGLPRRRLRLALGRLLDVPGHEPRHRCAGRALRLDLEPQLRGPPGQAAAARTWSPRRWPRPRRSRAASSTSGSGLAMEPVHQVAGRSPCSTGPTSTPTRSSPSSS